MQIALPTLPDLRTRDGWKRVSRFIVARATSITVVTVINQNVDKDDLKTYEQVGVVVGSHVLGEMVAEATKPFVDKQIDSAADAIAEMKAEAEKQKKIHVESTRVE